MEGCCYLGAVYSAVVDRPFYHLSRYYFCLLLCPCWQSHLCFLYYQTGLCHDYHHALLFLFYLYRGRPGCYRVAQHAPSCFVYHLDCLGRWTRHPAEVSPCHFLQSLQGPALKNF